ncbi:TATA box-binding protein-like protein 1 [Halocaridina rubra]|uniref:TATA box-binding protein-like protein 1 n=1 Tax=Halocaridina rubra TaxID=373956 RepID=A0AAN9ACF5_HALRR
MDGLMKNILVELFNMKDMLLAKYTSFYFNPGSTSEDEARRAARRIARIIQKLEYPAKFRNFRIVNVLGTCTMPFNIKITPFSQTYRDAASYEPELHPGVTYKIDHPKATLKIFSTGSITVTVASVVIFGYPQAIWSKVRHSRVPKEGNHSRGFPIAF